MFLFVFILSEHFNACAARKLSQVKGSRTLDGFFGKETDQRASASTSSQEVELVTDDGEDDQFEGADAIVSDK